MYKISEDKIEIKDIDTLTKENDSFFMACDLNAKYPAWYNRRSNQTRLTFLGLIERNVHYIICVSDSPTHFPYIPYHNPDTLDFAKPLPTTT